VWIGVQVRIWLTTIAQFSSRLLTLKKTGYFSPQNNKTAHLLASSCAYKSSCHLQLSFPAVLSLRPWRFVSVCQPLTGYLPLLENKKLGSMKETGEKQFHVSSLTRGDEYPQELQVYRYRTTEVMRSELKNLEKSEFNSEY